MGTPILADAFRHHVWATLRLIDACLELEEGQLQTNVPGTYGTVLDTMRHIVGGDCGYLFVLTDGRVAMVDEAEEATLDLRQLRALTERNAAEWERLVAGDLDTDRILTRHRDDGSQSHAPLGVRIAQAVHHGTDHRSQICTALTSLAMEPPEIDVWAYATEVGRLSVTEPDEAPEPAPTA